MKFYYVHCIKNTSFNMLCYFYSSIRTVSPSALTVPFKKTKNLIKTSTNLCNLETTTNLYIKDDIIYDRC